MSSAVWFRRLSWALVFAVVALLTITLRAIVDGEGQMRASDAAFHRGDVRTAVVHARRAAIAYAPGAPHVRAAYERLVATALGAEASGDAATARAAWRAVRGAALETSHVWTPHALELERANRALARLSNPGSPKGVDEDRRVYEEAKRLLERDERPRPVWVAVLALGLVAAAAGLGWIGLRAVGRDGRISLLEARWGIVLALIGAACWTIAVYKA
jgi:hypothetical protein